MSKSLDILIPTRNRANHLDITLDQLRNIAPSILEVTSELNLIVGDNCSIDQTHAVLAKHKRLLQLECGVKLASYRVNKTTTLGGNLGIGLRHTQSEYILLLADDDDLKSELCTSIELFFDSNATVAKSIVLQPNLENVEIEFSYRKFNRNEVKQFVWEIAKWPKLPGMIFNREVLIEALGIEKIRFESFRYFPHLFLADLILQYFPVALNTGIEVAKVREDFIEQAWFPLYVANFMNEEIEDYFGMLTARGKTHTHLELINSDHRVLQLSVQALFAQYFQGARYSVANLEIYRGNIYRFLCGARTSTEGIPLGRLEPRLWIKFFFVALFATFQFFIGLLHKKK